MNKIELKIINMLMQTINMLIPDLLNLLFDQCDHDGITVMRSVSKRKTNYANKYSLLRYYELGKLTIKSISKRGNIKSIKSVCVYSRNDILLKLAACYGHVLVIKYLASIGADIHAYDDRALILSAENGHLDVVKYLISVGANIHADDDFALKMSATNGYLETVKYLVEIGAKIHAENDYALRYSTYDGHLETVKYLVSVGANIHANNNELQSNGMIRDHFGHLFV